MSASDKPVITRKPRVMMANILVVYHILPLSQSPKSS